MHSILNLKKQINLLFEIKDRIPVCIFDSNSQGSKGFGINLKYIRTCSNYGPSYRRFYINEASPQKMKEYRLKRS